MARTGPDVGNSDWPPGEWERAWGAKWTKRWNAELEGAFAIQERAMDEAVAADEVPQVGLCVGGMARRHMFLPPLYDHMPPAVRERLQTSPHNLCLACLVIRFMPAARGDWELAIDRMEQMTDDLANGADPDAYRDWTHAHPDWCR